MNTQQLPRPRQVTTAAVMIIAGSVAVVLTIFGQLASLNSLDSRRALEQALSRPPADGLGISLETARTGLRVMAMIAAACATAAAILGYQVLQRSRSARLALAVLAAPLFVTGIASGGILSSVVVAAALMLWLQPARDWFNGVATAARPEPTTHGTPAARRDAFESSVPVQAAPPAQHPQQPPAYGAPYGAGQPVAQATRPETRPTTLVWACVLTWVGTALAAALMATIALALLAVPDLYEQVSQQTPELAAQGITESQVVRTAVVSAVVVLLWSALATFFAIQAWRRRPWARIALLASAAAAGVLSLLGALASVVLVVPLVACVTVVVLLSRTEVRWWLR